MLSNDPALYRPGAFGGARVEDVDATLREFKKLLMGPEVRGWRQCMCHSGG